MGVIEPSEDAVNHRTRVPSRPIPMSSAPLAEGTCPAPRPGNATNSSTYSSTTTSEARGSNSEEDLARSQDSGVMVASQSSSSKSVEGIDNGVEMTASTSASGFLPEETCKLLYARSSVYVHPSSYLKDNVEGWLAVVQRGNPKHHTTVDILLCWIPSSLLERSSPQDHQTFVAVDVSPHTGEIIEEREVIEEDDSHLLSPPLFSALSSISSSPLAPPISLPISRVYSLQLTPPTLSTWYASLQIYPYPPPQNGQQKELPTLYFHDDERRAALGLGSPTGTPSASPVGTTRHHRSQSQPTGSVSRRGVAPPPSNTNRTIESFLSAVRPHVSLLLRSQLDSTVYLINPNRQDMEVHSTAIFDDDLVDYPPSNSSPAIAARLSHPSTRPAAAQARNRHRGGNGRAGPSILHESLGGASTNGHASSSPSLLLADNSGSRAGSDSATFADGIDRGEPRMEQLPFKLLSAGAWITKSARSAAHSAAHQVLSHPLAQPVLRHIPPPILAATHARPELYSRWTEEAGMGGYDSAKVYLAKWARVVAEEGERARRAEFHRRSGDEDGNSSEEDDVGGWEILATTYHLTPHHSSRASNQPISLTEWTRSLCDFKTGQLLLSASEARKRIFQRGLADDGARKEVWPGLLGVWEFGWTADQRVKHLDDKKIEYERLRSIWMGESEDAADVRKTEQFAEESHRIEIDCRRTDRTQPMFMSETEHASPLSPTTPAGSKLFWTESVSSAHPASNDHVRRMQEILMTYNYYEKELGYVQGMSDLLSPIYVVVDGDASLAFWCFVGLMSRTKGNFLRDQSGMKKQLSTLQELIALMDPQLHRHLERTGSLNLFFVFRWMLCLFKREFEWQQVLRLWEVLWTDHYGTHFHVFFALAIVEAHRDVIIRYLTEFDEILKYVNELSHTMDVEPLLARAEILYLTFRSIVERVDTQKKEEAERLVALSTPAPTPLFRRRSSNAADALDKEVGAKVKVQPKYADVSEQLRELLD